MEIFRIILLVLLIICAIATAVSKKTLTAVIIYMSYSLIMSVIWVLLESPDLAITEAAVGAGVDTVLFFVALKRIHLIDTEDPEDEEKQKK